MMTDYEGGPNNQQEASLQRALFLAQIVPKHSFALDRDRENRSSGVAGDQYFVHNAPEIGEPPTGRLWMKPAGFADTLHNVSEMYVYTPEEDMFWQDGFPLVSFVKVKNAKDMSFMFGITEKQIMPYHESEKPFAEMRIDDEGKFVIHLDAIPAEPTIMHVTTDELGEVVLSPDYYDGLVAALNDCIEAYRLFPQTLDHRIA